MSSKLAGVVLALLSGAASPIQAAQYCDPDLPREAPDGRFIDYGDGTVADKHTGLVWKKCLEGVSGENCDQGVPLKLNWQDALSLQVGSAWRLPNIKELSGVLDHSCTSPAVNQRIFPGDRAVAVWTSTPFAGATRDVWVMDLNDPVNTTALANERHAIWLVRELSP